MTEVVIINGPAVRECWEEIQRNRELLGNLVDATSMSATDLAARISALLEERAARRQIGERT